MPAMKLSWKKMGEGGSRGKHVSYQNTSSGDRIVEEELAAKLGPWDEGGGSDEWSERKRRTCPGGMGICPLLLSPHAYLARA
jgi:hypothetical protein